MSVRADVASAPRAQASVSMTAIAQNCERLRAELSGGTELCAVVKADGYGHGAVQSAANDLKAARADLKQIRAYFKSDPASATTTTTTS